MTSHTQTPLSLQKGGAAFWTPDLAGSSASSPSALEPEGRLKMVFGTGCQTERLFKFLYIVQTFLLAGTVCFYFQGSVEEAAPDNDIAGDTSQPVGVTLRPVWGPMDKCYPGTTQRRRVKGGKKEAAAAGTPKAMGGLSDAAPKEELGVRSQDAGEVRSPAEEAASPTPAGKEVAEEKEVAGPPGCEASEVERKEDRPGGPHSP